MKKFCFSSFLFLFAAALSGQEVTPTAPVIVWDTLLNNYKGETLYLPANPSIQLEAEIVLSKFDGMDRKDLFLRSEQIQFKSIVLDNWQNLRTKSGSDYSVVFANRYEPSLKIGLKLYNKRKIASGFNEDSMLGFLAGLRAKHRSQKMKILDIPPGFRPIGYFSYLLGNPVFLTDIQFQKSSDRKVLLRNISYYFSAEDFAIVASIEGTQDLATLNKNTLERFLHNFSVYKPE